MKQNITLDDLNMLSEKGKERLREWWKNYTEKHDIPPMVGSYEAVQWLTVWPMDDNAPILLDIGQMIELLGWEDMQFYLIPDNAYCRRKYPKDRLNKWTVQDGDYENANKSFNGNTLCDALWAACVEILEKD